MWGLGWLGLGHWAGGLGIFGGLLRLVLLGAVVVVIVVAARNGFGRRRGGPPEDSSLEILRRRYANGEISKEEFEEKKKDLSP
jgi:putative membrane protein